MTAFVITQNDGNTAYLTAVDDSDAVTIIRPPAETKEEFQRLLKVGLTVEGTPSPIAEIAPGVN